VIRALAATGKNLVVVNISGSPVAMPWKDCANAIVQGWYGGSESGHALADVLLGTVNPSGKLPFTIPSSLEDGPLKTERQFPGIQVEGEKYYQEYYDEGIFVGYRWYDTKGIPVDFAFGSGLSYTTFELSGARVKKDRVSVRVANTGDRAGAEVVQLYIAAPESSVERPAKELKGFEKVYLNPGESRIVTFEVTPQDLSYFDAEKHEWVAEKGEYRLLLGTASDRIAADLPYRYQ